MNGWMIAFLIWYAISFGVALVKYVDGSGWVKIGPSDLFLGPAISIALLYMGGAFG